MTKRDHVDEIVEQWRNERPDLDVSPMEVVGRVSRLARRMESRLGLVFREYGINSGEFDVLATLRRSGKPYELSPTTLTGSAMLTSGAMTNRLDRLEAAGLVSRKPDPGDRRSTIVVLTPAGLELIDRAIESHVENEAALLEGCSESEVRSLVRVLRKLLGQLEP